MSAIKYRRVIVDGQLQLGEVEVVADDLDVNGVLALQIGAGGQGGAIQLLLEQGLALSGVAIFDGDVELTGEELRGTILVLVGLGAGALIVGEDLGAPAANRFEAVPVAANIGVDERQVLLRYSVADSRWKMPNWAYFVAAILGDWAIAPTKTDVAIDALAASGSLRSWTMNINTLITGGNGQLYYDGPAGTITSIHIVLSGVLTVGAATLTPKIDGTPITDGAISIPVLGSGANAVYASTPSALNEVAPGVVLSADVTGLNLTATTRATMTFSIKCPI